MSIVALVTTYSLVQYNRFNRTQALKQTAEDVKSKIRQVQNKAMVGEKPTGTTCAGKSLNFWSIEFYPTGFDKQYNISISCGPLTPLILIEQLNLPPNLVFKNNQRVDFKPLAQGTTSPVNIDIYIGQGSLPIQNCAKITVTPSGEIKLEILVGASCQ